MNTLSLILNLAVTLLLAHLRIIGTEGKVFQACAHLYVGALLMGWWKEEPPVSTVYFWLAFILSVVEAYCFVYPQ